MNVRDVMSEEPFSVTPATDVVSVAICIGDLGRHAGRIDVHEPVRV